MANWVGIDVSKSTHKYRSVDDTGNPVGKAVSFANTREGFTTAVENFRALGEVNLALEATGPYWLPLYDFLTNAKFKVTVLNPLQVSAFRESGLRKTKCDSKDAYWIAEFLRIGYGRPMTVPEPTVQTLRELSRYRFALVDEICNHKRRVLGLIVRVFPEYEDLFSDVFLVSSMKLLETAATPDDILALDTDEFVELLEKASRGRFGKEKVDLIQSTAATTIGVSWLADAARIEIVSMLQIIRFLEQQVKQLEAELARLMKSQCEFLSTVTGIGPVLGAAIVGEVLDINRFETAKAFVAFAGINPSVHQSGQFDGQHMHMSKRGSPHLRRALWMVASNAYKDDPDLQAYYTRKKAEGKHHNTVIGAIARKMAGRIYAVWKGNQPYRVAGPTEAGTSDGDQAAVQQTAQKT